MYEDSDRSSVESYFYIKNSDNTKLFFSEQLVTSQIPSQFLRKTLSEQCNIPEWNWKVWVTIEGRQKYVTRIMQMAKLLKMRMIHKNSKI